MAHGGRRGAHGDVDRWTHSYLHLRAVRIVGRWLAGSSSTSWNTAGSQSLLDSIINNTLNPLRSSHLSPRSGSNIDFRTEFDTDKDWL